MPPSTSKNSSTPVTKLDIKTETPRVYSLGITLYQRMKFMKQKFYWNSMRQGVLILALGFIWGVFSVLTDGTFISPRNLSNLLIQSCITATLTMGMVLVIVTGYIDLSVGAVLGFLGTLMALIFSKEEFGPIPAMGVFLLTMAVGILVGLWHGFWIAYQRVPAFIVTLASMLVFRGAMIGLSEGRTLSVDSFFNTDAIGFLETLGNGYLPGWGLTLNVGGTSLHGSTLLLGAIVIGLLCIREVLQRRRNQAMNHMSLIFYALIVLALTCVLSLYEGVPLMLLIVMILGLGCSFIAERTVFGRRLYALGGQLESARYSGIDHKKYTLYLFSLMGFLVSVAGILTVARLSAATTSAGQNAELDAIAAAVIGGISLMGGQGSIGGALLGALLMTSLDNGMSLMNLDATFQYIVKGLILLIAVWFDLRSRSSV
jgi:D-xylose transport system permease protein